jgi:hypothetical protein
MNFSGNGRAARGFAVNAEVPKNRQPSTPSVYWLVKLQDSRIVLRSKGRTHIFERCPNLERLAEKMGLGQGAR